MLRLPETERHIQTLSQEVTMALGSSQRKRAHLSPRFHAIMVLAVFLVSCMTPIAKRATETYDDRGNRIGGATDTYEFTQIYRYHYDDVFDAAYKALFRSGFQIEREDREHGIIQGSVIRQHVFSGATMAVPFTASVKVREVNSTPRTELMFVLDTHWGIGYAIVAIKSEPPSKKFGPELVADINKVLSTFD
jgi:hypothetical protein